MRASFFFSSGDEPEKASKAQVFSWITVSIYTLIIRCAGHDCMEQCSEKGTQASEVCCKPWISLGITWSREQTRTLETEQGRRCGESRGTYKKGISWNPVYLLMANSTNSTIPFSPQKWTKAREIAATPRGNTFDRLHSISWLMLNDSEYSIQIIAKS